MSIDKALYQAPVGIGALAGEPDATHDFEIEIVDPKGVKIKAGGLEIDMDPDVADDGEPYEVKMPRLVAEMNTQFSESAKLEKLIKLNLKELGYGE